MIGFAKPGEVPASGVSAAWLAKLMVWMAIETRIGSFRIAAGNVGGVSVLSLDLTLQDGRSEGYCQRVSSYPTW
jgi:hypothetical protein